MYRIDGVLQHFAWGDTKAIAEVRGVDPSGRPEAEFWLGAHPNAPSRVVFGDPSIDHGGIEDDTLTLDALIDRDPAAHLGPVVAERFDGLPFLLKLLAAAEPLSIQAHPDGQQAIDGFERENRLGIAVSAPNRSYRDERHKPELICAITRFEAKCGLRELGATRRLLSLFTDRRVEPLRSLLAGDTAEDALRWLLTAAPEQSAAVVDGVVNDCRRLVAEIDNASDDGCHPASEFEPDIRWTIEINRRYSGDPGVVVALLLNHIVLEAGEALYLAAGILHSYLNGFAVELMANSDNVLRGGLTEKHVNAQELLGVVAYRSYDPTVQRARGPVHRYRVDAADFGLVRYTGDAHRCMPDGPEIVLVTEGSARLESNDSAIEVGRGEAVFVPYSTGPYTLAVGEGHAMVWRAVVGH